MSCDELELYRMFYNFMLLVTPVLVGIVVAILIIMYLDGRFVKRK